jgi:hypothetical protein
MVRISVAAFSTWKDAVAVLDHERRRPFKQRRSSRASSVGRPACLFLDFQIHNTPRGIGSPEIGLRRHGELGAKAMSF